MASTAAMIGAVANTLRLSLIDFTGMPAAVAAFTGALAAGLLASLIKKKQRISKNFTYSSFNCYYGAGIVFLSRILYLGVMSLNEAVSWLAAAILIVVALPLGLIFARIFTDRTFRYCT